VRRCAATAATLKACNATVSAGQNTVLDRYFRARGPSNSPQGVYTGTISVTADQGSATIPGHRHVWNLSFTAQPSTTFPSDALASAAGNTTAVWGSVVRNKVMVGTMWPPTHLRL